MKERKIKETSVLIGLGDGQGEEHEFIGQIVVIGYWTGSH